MSFTTLLLGRGLGEIPPSLQRWLDQRERAQRAGMDSPQTARAVAVA